MSNHKHTPAPWATDITEAAELVASEGVYDRNRFREALERIAESKSVKDARRLAAEALQDEAIDSRIAEASVYINHGSGKGGTVCTFRHDPDDGLDIRDPEQQANAKLAAASPQLLDITEATFRRVGESQNISSAHRSVSDARAQLKRLLPDYDFYP